MVRGQNVRALAALQLCLLAVPIFSNSRVLWLLWHCFFLNFCSASSWPGNCLWKWSANWSSWSVLDSKWDEFETFLGCFTMKIPIQLNTKSTKSYVKSVQTLHPISIVGGSLSSLFNLRGRCSICYSHKDDTIRIHAIMCCVHIV